MSETGKELPMTEFNEWTIVAPGRIALARTQYEIKHEIDGAYHWFTVCWRGAQVGQKHLTVEAAKRNTLAHLNEMLLMGYDV